MASPASANAGTWVVQPGDALSLVAARFDVTVEQIRKWNELEGDRIEVGQELKLEPGKQAPQQPDTQQSKRPTHRPAPDTPKPGPGRTYQVQPGDNLLALAERFDVGIDELQRWNPGLDPDRIRAGQTLNIGERVRRVEYAIQPGDYLLAIAARFGVSVSNITAWNPNVNPDRIRAGEHLTIYTPRPVSTSESVGTPNHGRLKHAERLPPHPGYEIRDPDRAWGTQEAVLDLVAAFDHLRRRRPGAPRVEVHDLSLRGGGPIDDHRSHQSGRDVDLAYFRPNCRGACAFRKTAAGQLDVKTQWALLKFWLRRNLVEAIFMDYRLQRRLYRYARAQGHSRDELMKWFQYPRGRTAGLGIIRHFPKHRDHMHVRFACHETDEQCDALRVFSVGPQRREWREGSTDHATLASAGR